MNTPVGCYVRVWVGGDESDDPAYDTALYIVGCATPAEAEAAVRKARLKSGERIQALEPFPSSPTRMGFS